MMKLPRYKGISAWVRWSVREKGAVALLILAAIAVGLFGIGRMNKDEFPTFQLKQGLVAGIYPGATAAEVENQLAKPLEEYLFTFKEVNRETLYSVSREGMCYLYVDLEQSVPQSRKDEVWSKIKLGLQTRKLTLPAGVLAVAVLDDFGNTSSILIAMESSDKSYSELEDYADELCTRLHRIPDLAKAEVIGSQQEEIAVTLDRERLSAYGIDPSQLLLEYQSSSLSVPAGTFGTDYTSSSIHVNSTVGSEREVAERIIWSDGNSVVRLKDIAKVERRVKDPESFISYNGNSCLVINVEMRPDHNIVAFGEEVEEVIGSFESTLPDSVRLSRICDQPKVVDRSVWSFLRDLIIAMIVVVLVMLMLFPMRSALIASSGVPVCVAVSIAVMYLTGIPLNTVTLAALIVVLGMIVDDSIITMDGYMQHLGIGDRGVDAAANSAKELFMPTFMATLAICLMFFPTKLIITGYLGDFIRFFPWIILTALVTSLLYAVTAVPALEVRFIGDGLSSRKKNFLARAQDGFFSFLQRVYEFFLDKCFAHPRITLAIGVAAIALGVFMFSRINIQMMPKAARSFFVIELYTDAGKGIDITRQRADSLEKILLADGRVTSVTSFVGTGAPRFAATYTPVLPSPHTAQLIVNTKSNRDTEDILREYPPRFQHIFPDALLHFKQMDYQAVEAPVSMRFKAENREDIIEPASRVQAYLASLTDQAQWVHSDMDNFAPSVEINLDSDEASRLGLSPALLSLSLAGTFGGENIGTLWEGSRQVPVNIYSEGISGDMPYELIADQQVPTLIPGVSVPLRQVAAITPGWQPYQLYRYGGEKCVTVSCDLIFGVSQPEVQKELEEFVKAEIEPVLPEGVTYSYHGLASMNKAVVPQIAWSFTAACLVLFIFLLMHFKKVSVAVLTMALSLLCLFGASFGLWLFGQDFSITAALGLISLVGIVVRNGILMFDYAEEKRGEGESVRESALASGKRRMRPIFLTSCTTALGVLPMIISGDLLWMPMGITICFGTLLSIFLITLVMPVSYWQIFKKADKK